MPRTDKSGSTAKGSKAGLTSYHPGTPGDWSTVPDTVQKGLDELAAAPGGGTSLPVDDATSIVTSGTDKQMRIDVGAVADSTVRVLTMPNTDITLVKNNVSNSAPTVNNDNTEGYARGSHWVRSTTGQLWVATNVSTGAAVWSPVAFGFNAYDQAGDPTVNNDDTQGFQAGSLWTNTTASPDRVFILKDPATGAADWIEIVDNYAHPDHTGDVTSSGDGDTTIADEAVTNAKLAHMAQSTIKGRAAAAGTGDATDLSVAQILTILGLTHILKDCHIFYMENPGSSDDFPMWCAPSDITVTKVIGFTDTGTVDFNLVERTTPAGGGVDIIDSGGPADPDLRADADGESTTTFSNAGVDAEDWIAVTSSGSASSPTKLWVAMFYTIDA